MYRQIKAETKEANTEDVDRQGIQAKTQEIYTCSYKKKDKT